MKWFSSYLTGRTQFLRTSMFSSLPLPVLLESLKDQFLAQISLGSTCRSTATDSMSPVGPHMMSKIYGFCKPCDAITLSDIMSDYADVAMSYTKANQLQANPSKTEVLWCSSGCRQHQIPTMSVQIRTTDMLSVTSVHDLSVYIDSDITMCRSVAH